MTYYSVATTKDKLSSLIDKALAGEEVIITRHGKPTVEIRVLQPSEKRGTAWYLGELDKFEKLPVLPGKSIMQQIKDEYK